MKKLPLLLTFVLIFHFVASSQSCLPDGITFTTQEQIDNFQSDYPGCTEIEGAVNIIVGEDITDLNGLLVLTAIGEDLWIQNTEALTSLTGLDNLNSIGGYLLIDGNQKLVNLSGLNNLTSVGEYIEILLNHALVNLTGLNSLISIGNEFFIFHNEALLSLTGLDKLAFVKNLWIRDNDALTSLAGLDELTSIEETLSIRYNDSLKNLAGLDNLSSIGADLLIKYNSTLTNLTSLENLTLVGENIWIGDNNELPSLSGLESIESTSIGNLVIINNNSLATCEVLSICNYLSSPNGVITIYNNAEGCNSAEEIQDACNAGIGDQINGSPVSIHPNPAENIITISTSSGTEINNVYIYNQIGQKVRPQKGFSGSIDISELQPGVYVVEVVLGDLKVREKLIVK